MRRGGCCRGAVYCDGVGVVDGVDGFDFFGEVGVLEGVEGGHFGIWVLEGGLGVLRGCNCDCKICSPAMSLSVSTRDDWSMYRLLESPHKHRPAGLMVRRLTSDQEIAGSSPASVTVSFFLFCLSYPGSSMIDSKKANFTSLYYCSGDYYTVILTRSNIRRRKLTDEK